MRTLKLKAYYLPTCNVRLISTNTVTSTYHPETFLIDSTGGRLSGIPNHLSRRPIFAPLNKSSNLIVSIGHKYFGSHQRPSINAASLPSLLDGNHNLSRAEKELLN